MSLETDLKRLQEGDPTFTGYLWLDGQRHPGAGEPLPVQNPATGEWFAKCQTASEDDVARAVQAAKAAFDSGSWSRASRHTRADVLEKAGHLLRDHIPGLVAVEVGQTGRCVREMRAQVPSLVRWFQYYAAVLRTEERPLLPTAGTLHNWLERVPLGVVVQITPFNHPLLIAVKKLAPALAAGNSVIVKPSELTPLTTILLGPILQAAGLPDGVLSILPGLGPSVGKSLVSHPTVRKVDVTGGTKAGRAIGAIVGGNLARYTAELGGKAPLVVFDKADVDLAVNGIAFGSFIASGQTCVAATRILVQNSILPEVQEKLVHKAESIRRRMGSPTNPESMMGTVITAQQQDRILEITREAVTSGKATVLCGAEKMVGKAPLDGTDLSHGFFVAPTVVACSAGQRQKSVLETALWREELFGPVVALVGFDTEEEAVALANDTEFGLGAALWTRDLSQAFRVSGQIAAGIVWVNTHHRNDPSSPWGGATASSGVGSENGAEAYLAYTTTKSIVINYASAEEAAGEDWFREGSGQVRYG